MELVTFTVCLRDGGLDLVGVAGIPSGWELGVVVTGMFGNW